MTSGVSLRELLWRGFLCTAYIAASTGLIRFNKHLMSEDHFPFAMALTAIHLTFGTVLCTLLYSVYPSLFPGMEGSKGKKVQILTWFVPIGATMAVSIFCSNQAYLYASVPFLQFMKGGNVFICFFFSCALGLQMINRLKVAVLTWIIVTTSFTVSGEKHFFFIGFVFQLVSQLMDCTRIVMGEKVMRDIGGGLKLDPMSYMLMVSPMCLVAALIGNLFTWDSDIPHRLATMWPLLVPNALLAFVLNLLVTCLVKEVSGVGFTLTGITKDIAVIVVSAALAGESVTVLQVVSFVLLIAGICFWSYMKLIPDGPIVKSVEAALGMTREPDETTPLQA